MPNQSDNPLNFWQELKRRRVIRIILVYAAAAFALLELVDIIAEPFGLPGWTLKLVFILLSIGLIIAIILSWIYDVTPEGVQKTKPITKETGEPKEPPTKIMGWKITTYASIAIIIGLLIVNIFGGRRKAEALATMEKSIAVLPFENLSSDKEQSWFSDGITDVVINQLSKISDLRVLSRTSTLKYKEEKKLIPEMGEELGVKYIMEGTIQRDGNQIRISIQLIRVENEDHIWSELYDREYKDLFKIQSDIAQTVASKLEAIITPKEKQLIEKIPTNNMTAFDYHLQARDQYFNYLFSHDNRYLDTVIQLARKSLSLDPEFAQAYYWIGNSFSGDIWLSTYYKPYYQDSALFYFNKALKLDSNLVDAYLGRGTYYYEQAQTEKALHNLNTAIRLDPNYARAYITLGMIYYDSRDYLNAMANYKKAEMLERGDNFLYIIHYGIWWIYVSIGDLEKAYLYSQETMQPEQAYTVNWWLLTVEGKWEELLGFAKDGLALQPENGGLYQLRAIALFGLGRMEEAEGSIRNAINYASLNLNSYNYVGGILWANGKKDEAMDYFNKQIVYCKESIRQKNQYGITVAAYDLASIYAFLENIEEAMKWLREYEKLGFTNGTHDHIKVDPLFDNLRNNEEFQEIIRRANDAKAGIRARINKMENQVL